MNNKTQRFLHPVLDTSMLRYLYGDKHQCKNDHRMSRWEAYFSLLRRQEAKCAIDMENGPRAWFHVNSAVLTEEWGWHRNTIRKFLRRLSEGGALSYLRATYGMKIRLNFYDIKLEGK